LAQRAAPDAGGFGKNGAVLILADSLRSKAAVQVVIQAPCQNPCKQVRIADFGNQSLTKL